MHRKELQRLKSLPKRLGLFQFKPLKKGSLPDPWKKIGGPRLTSTGLIDVGNDMRVLFISRSGETRDRRAFYGYLYRQVAAGLEPVFIMHYHPSHKGIHMQANCESQLDYVHRQLPGAIELQMKGKPQLDPIDDQLQLVSIFCARFGVKIQPSGDDLLQ
jgi:hypothetical protein